MSETTKQALQYVKNTGGGATKADFMDDHEPIGGLLWDSIRVLVREDDHGRIFLTEDGEKVLGA